MRSFWSELIFDRSKIGAVFGEVYAAEWAINHIYENIISLRNPYSHTPDILYPFGANLIATDAGNAFFLVFLKPFLSTHQAFYVTIALGLFAANVGMYLLLRKLNFSKIISFLLGLSFGYTTYLMVRVGHITYFSIFGFPLFYYFILSVLKSTKFKQKFFYTLGAALTLVTTLYLNLYFFVMLAFSIGLFILY